MSVVDCSVLVAVLVGECSDADIIRQIADGFHAPDHLDVEVVSALRGLTMGRKLSDERAAVAIARFNRLRITRCPFASLSGRVWQLRHQYTPYDAAYIALAELLDVSLLTADANLDAGSHRAKVRVID